MSYVQLPIVEIELDKLLLDLENYRIPTRRNNEEAALKYLYTSEDVIGLAKLILRDGYFDNEVPIVTPASPSSLTNIFTVLEGNRRVSALKALHNPSIIPEHQSELLALLKRYAVEVENLPEKIRVIVAPNRETAAPHIARLHTGLSKKRWSRDQQATFYYSLLDEQTTVDDVKAQYPDVDVSRFIRMAVVRRFLSAAPFTDHTLCAYAASDKLKMSSFEYAYRRKDIAKTIGIEFDSAGMLIPTASAPESIAAELDRGALDALEFLVSEFRAGHLNTRSPEFKANSEQHDQLMDRLSGFLTSESAQSTSVSKSTKSTPSENVAQEARTEHAEHPKSSESRPSSSSLSDQQDGRAGSRGPNHPHTKPCLDLSGLNYESAPLNLKLRYFELRKINISDLPIASAILMRTILETTIKSHFEGPDTPAKGELAEVFKLVASQYGNYKTLKHTINTIRSGTASKPGSIQWFNLLNHSAAATTNQDEVRQAWQLVNPLLRHLLVQPGQTSTPSSL